MCPCSLISITLNTITKSPCRPGWMFGETRYREKELSFPVIIRKINSIVSVIPLKNLSLPVAMQMCIIENGVISPSTGVKQHSTNKYKEQMVFLSFHAPPYKQHQLYIQWYRGVL